MARIRTIKPDFWADEKMANVCMQARLLYIGMWNLSDDYGVCKGNPNWIKSQLFAYDEINKDQMVTWLKELEFLGRIVPFDDSGETFYHIPNFLKHQRIKNPSEFRNAEVPPSYPSPTPALPQPDGRPTPSKVRYSKVEVREGKVEAPPDDIPYETILLDLNEKAGTKCRLSPPTRKAIQARWAEGFRLADFQHVHTVKCQDWLHDPGMRKHLHPDTLYRPSKFEKYVNQEIRKPEQEWTPPND